MLMQSIEEYLALVIFMGLAGIISCALLLAGHLGGTRKTYPEKDAAYECGFPAFGDARGKFSIRFYLVAILFIIFDLEIAFLFPWALSFYDIGVDGYVSVLIFLGVLMVGFVYEWRTGALEWH